MSSASMVTQMWSVNSVTTLHSTLGLLLESGTNENTEIVFFKYDLTNPNKKTQENQFQQTHRCRVSTTFGFLHT